MKLKKLLKKTIFYKWYCDYQKRKFRRKCVKDYKTKPRLEVVKNEFYRRMGYYPDFDNPKTLNEKICWLKVFWYNPLAIICSDK